MMDISWGQFIAGTVFMVGLFVLLMWLTRNVNKRAPCPLDHYEIKHRFARVSDDHEELQVLLKLTPEDPAICIQGDRELRFSAMKLRDMAEELDKLADRSQGLFRWGGIW